MRFIKGLLFGMAISIFLIACGQNKTPKEKVKDGIEEVKDGVKESAKSVKDKTKDAADDIKDGVKETTKEVKKDIN